MLRQEGPAVLARYDEVWFRARRRHGLQHLACGVILLVGLLLCGWPAQPMAVFMRFALLGRRRQLSFPRRLFPADEHCAPGTTAS